MDEAAEAVRRLSLRVPKRRRVFEAVVACPGTHARRLSRDLGMALGVVEHHVRHLERHGMVFAHRNGRRRTLYACGHVDPQDARLIHVLRKPSWCRVLAILGTRERSLPELALELGLPAATVAYTLRRLRTDGLVEQVRIGREVAYVGLHPAAVARLLATLRLAHAFAGPDPAFAGVVERAARHVRRPASGRPAGMLTVAVKD